MSRKEYIQCDACEKTCSNPLPSDWLALREGGDYTYTNDPTQHFCSHLCLARWLSQKGTEFAPPEPQEQTACKVRRFLLVDGNTAEITEGVKWGDGRVTLDPDRDVTGLRYYSSWDHLKEMHDGSGVQWIDQEVSK